MMIHHTNQVKEVSQSSKKIFDQEIIIPVKYYISVDTVVIRLGDSLIIDI